MESDQTVNELTICFSLLLYTINDIYLTLSNCPMRGVQNIHIIALATIRGNTVF